LATGSTTGIGFAAAAGLDGERASGVVNERTQGPAPESISSKKI
jgi:hypothetical protein